MIYLFLTSWIIGIIIGLVIIIIGFVKEVKEIYDLGYILFVMFLLTGYMTTLPFICAALISHFKIKIQ